MKIIDISKCNEEVISYINELQNKYAELEKLNKELDKSTITIFEENEYLHKEIERLNNGLKDIKSYIEKNKTSFSDLYIPASDVVSILVIIDRLLGSDKE